MATALSAFGLRLSAGFPLPGDQPPGEPGLPVLELELETAAELALRWSGPAMPAAWRGRLGDGEEFAIERGRAGDLLFRYGGGASFLLDTGAARLGCAPTGAGELAWLRVLLTRVLPNVSLARGYEALHAAAAATDRGVIALAAASGAGKSTLAVELVRRGWPLFADDTIVLGRDETGVLAHPAAPYANLPVADDGADLGPELGRLGDERWVSIEGAPVAAAPLAAVVLLEREPGRGLDVERLAANPLQLAPFMLGLPDDEGRDADRFSLYADLVESVPLLRLAADPERTPAELAGALEAALELELVGAGGSR
jgi:hypothetical protein